MKENDVIMISSTLAYITPIRLSFCTSAGERESLTEGEGGGREGEGVGRGRGREREKFS